MPDKNPAVETAKKVERERELEIKGVKVRAVSVSASLIDEVMARIKPPPVPMWHNPDKDRDEPNPSDPDYLDALSERDRKRGQAAIDAMVMFGVDLLNGLPQDDNWKKKLQLLARRGHLDLDGFDLNDDIDAEFLYKRYILLDTELLNLVTALSGITQEDIESAEESFLGDEVR